MYACPHSDGDLLSTQPSSAVSESVTIITSTSTVHITVTLGAPGNSSSWAWDDGLGGTSVADGGGGATGVPPGGGSSGSVGSEVFGSGPVGPTDAGSVAVESASVGLTFVGTGSSVEPGSVVYGSKGSTRVPEGGEGATPVGVDSSGASLFVSTSVEPGLVGSTPMKLTSAIGINTIEPTSIAYTSARYASIGSASAASDDEGSAPGETYGALSSSPTEGEGATSVLASVQSITQVPAATEESAPPNSTSFGLTLIGSDTMLSGGKGSTSLAHIGAPRSSPSRSDMPGLLAGSFLPSRLTRPFWDHGVKRRRKNYPLWVCIFNP